MVLRAVSSMVAVCVLATAGVEARQAPALDELVRKAGQYYTTYSAQASGLSLDELFLLVETSEGRMRVPQRVASDLVVVNFERLLIGLRDPFSIDTRRLRERNPKSPRLVHALQNPTEANWNAAQQFVRQNAHYLQHNVVVWFSDPMLALQFVSPMNQPQLTYKLEGTKKLNGVEVHGLGFREKAAGPRILSTIPGNAESSGRLWVDPADGSIHATELWVQSFQDVVRLNVSFARESSLKMLVPRSASHNFAWREWGKDFTSAVGGIPMKFSYEANVEYSNPNFTAIDLNKR